MRNKNIDPESGSATLQTAAIILFCALVGAASLSFIGTAARSIARGKGKASDSSARSDILAAIDQALAALDADVSPTSDAPSDPAYAHKALGACDILIKDISSKINPNWIRKGMLEETALSRVLKPGKTAADLQQYREDSGLSLDPSFYAGFFSDKDTQDFLSPYSYPNINSSDEFALRRMARDAGLNETEAQAFHGIVKAQVASPTIYDDAKLAQALGNRFSALQRVLSAQGQWNVNFLPEPILKALLSYPPWKIPAHAEKYQLLVNTRSVAPIDDDGLRRVLGLPAGHSIYGYLGVRTWFWGIEASKDGVKGRAIFARSLPLDPTASGKQARLVSLVWSRL